MNLPALSAHKACRHVSGGAEMLNDTGKTAGRGRAGPAGTLAVLGLLLSALLLAPSALAQSQSSTADAETTLWCGSGRDLTRMQRISGCGVLLAAKRTIIKAVVLAHDLR